MKLVKERIYSGYRLQSIIMRTMPRAQDQNLKIKTQVKVMRKCHSLPDLFSSFSSFFSFVFLLLTENRFSHTTYPDHSFPSFFSFFPCLLKVDFRIQCILIIVSPPSTPLSSSPPLFTTGSWPTPYLSLEKKKLLRDNKQTRQNKIQWNVTKAIILTFNKSIQQKSRGEFQE